MKKSRELQPYKPRPLVFTELEDLNYFAMMRIGCGYSNQEAYTKAMEFSNLVNAARAGKAIVESVSPITLQHKTFREIERMYGDKARDLHIDSLEEVKIEFTNEVMLLGIFSTAFARDDLLNSYDESGLRKLLISHAQTAFGRLEARIESERDGWRITVGNALGEQIQLEPIGSQGEETAA